MYKLGEDELGAITGGTGGTPDPTPTGGVMYKCTVCGTPISASSRDMNVTCPNVGCQCRFRVQNGKLVPLTSAL